MDLLRSSIRPDIEDQVLLCGFVVDGFVRELLLVIEFDGEYWHSFPEVIKKDQRKDQKLIDNGYSIVRVPERMYLTDKAVAVALVEAAIQEAK